MSISIVTTNGNACVNYENISGITYKNAVSRVNCALFPVITADFGASQEFYAHLNRVGRLLPHSNPA